MALHEWIWLLFIKMYKNYRGHSFKIFLIFKIYLVEFRERKGREFSICWFTPCIAKMDEVESYGGLTHCTTMPIHAFNFNITNKQSYHWALDLILTVWHKEAWLQKIFVNRQAHTWFILISSLFNQMFSIPPWSIARSRYMIESGCCIYGNSLFSWLYY